MRRRSGPLPPARERGAFGAVAVIQTLLGARVVWRLLRTAGGVRIETSEGPANGRVTVLVPVLDERGRLGPCLDGLLAQGPEVAEILVVDGGSGDGTQGMVAAYAERDSRIRPVDARPVPAGWNGKAHGLQVGLEQAAVESDWLLTIDADVRPKPGLAGSLLAFARRADVPALSVATRQEVSGAAEGLLHPALLTTLVYRFGIPGHATDRLAEIQANGQCFLLRRDVLPAVGGFASTRDSVCEDVTLARSLATAGHKVGFYETDGLVSVAMYAGWRDAWQNWTRSLPMRDRYFGWAGWLGLAEVALVQALPVPLAVGLWAAGRRGGRTGSGERRGDHSGERRRAGDNWGVARLRRGVEAPRSTHEAPPGLSTGPGRAGMGWSLAGGDGRRLVLAVNGVLAAVRLGVLVGTARAYAGRPWTYWVSPVCDLPAALGVWLSAGRRRHKWRGRPIVRGGPR